MFAVIPSVLTIETFTLPFSFCLPDHRRILQKSSFTLGPTIGLVWSLLYLGAEEIRLSGWSVYAMFSLLTTTYLLSAWIVFRFGSHFTTVTFCIVGGFLYTYILTNEITVIPFYLIMHHPFWVIIVSTVAAALLWRLMGDKIMLRSYYDFMRAGLPNVPAGLAISPLSSQCRKGRIAGTGLHARDVLLKKFPAWPNFQKPCQQCFKICLGCVLPAFFNSYRRVA